MKAARSNASLIDAFDRDDFDEADTQLRVAAGAAKPDFVAKGNEAIRVFHGERIEATLQKHPNLCGAFCLPLYFVCSSA